MDTVTLAEGAYWTSYEDGSGVELRRWDGSRWAIFGLDVYFGANEFVVISGPLQEPPKP